MTPILLISLIAFGFLAYKDLRAAFFLFIGLFPAYLIRFMVGGVPTTALEALFLILFFVWLWRREKRFIDIRGWRLLILLWIAAATVEAFVAPDLRGALGIWKAYFAEPVLFFIMANDFLRTDADRERATAMLAWTAVVIGASTVIQRFTGWGVPPPFNGHPIPPAKDAEFRSTAFYGYPNAVGLFLAPLVPLFVSRISMFSNSHGREFLKTPRFWLFAAATILCIAGIVLAQSEGAVFGLAAGLVFLGLMTKRTRKPLLVGGVIAALVLFSVPFTRTYLVEKLTINDSSGRVRRLMWSETWNMLKDRPVFGAGLNGYPAVFDAYHKARYIEIFQYPHQIILNFWTELGAAGVLIFLATVIQFFRKGRRSAALCAAMVVLLVHGLVDVPYFKNDLAMEFWLLVAFVSSAH